MAFPHCKNNRGPLCLAQVTIMLIKCGCRAVCIFGAIYPYPPLNGQYRSYDVLSESIKLSFLWHLDVMIFTKYKHTRRPHHGYRIIAKHYRYCCMYILFHYNILLWQWISSCFNQDGGLPMSGISHGPQSNLRGCGLWSWGSLQLLISGHKLKSGTNVVWWFCEIYSTCVLPNQLAVASGSLLNI